MTFIGDLPEDLKRLLDNCPKTGSGERRVHRWIMECGTRLRHFVLIDTASVLIARQISRQPKPREIEDTLEKAYGEAARDELFRRNTWPQPDARLIDNMVAEQDNGTPGLELLRKASGPVPDSAQAILGARFSPENLICAGLYAAHSIIVPQGRLKSPERFQFVVPNPMRAEYVTLPNGRKTERVLSNVLERRHIVLDFDLKGEWIEPVLTRWARVKYTPQDGMASLIQLTAQRAPLVMVVYSGNVSLQAWFECVGTSPERIAAWFNDACLLGADPVGWVTCQYFRMPCGLRKETKRVQEVVYFATKTISCDGNNTAKQPA